MTKPILRVENLYKKFKDTEVLKGLSLTVDEGEVVVIIGPAEPERAPFFAVSID
jgi:ABC-type histidine transport system ATPase subunit